MSTLKTIAIRHLNGSADNISLTSNGNVGIGNTNPSVRLVVNGPSTGTTPIVRINATSIDNGTFQWLSYAEAPLANGQNYVHIFGKSLSQYNSGYIGYKHAGDNLSTNSVTLGMYASDNLLNIYGSGNITQPSQASFIVYSNSGTLTYTSGAKVLFAGTVVRNVGSNYSTTNSRFTAPIAGSYLMKCQVWSYNQNLSATRFGINGSQSYGSFGNEAQSIGWNAYAMVEIMYLNAGDYVEVFNRAGTTYTDGNYSIFSGWLLG
jgi:hypothetical protein